MKTFKAIIIGAGPAGLTAAYELVKRSKIHPIILEKSKDLGGIARTVNYKGNRIDIGGHRFFSKSDQILKWWLKILPLSNPRDENLNPEKTDRVMLVRKRSSRIYFLGKFFKYPVSLDRDTLSKLGFPKTIRIGFSYLKSVFFPRPEKSLEDFFTNRFGRELYLTFFKSYTEKLWGIPCDQISALWGAQRVKGLSIAKAIKHYLKNLFRKKSDIGQKGTETSLIEQFLYPKLGPGQLWTEVAREIKRKGGEIITGYEVNKIYIEGNKIKAVEAQNEQGERKVVSGEYFFSTMPIKELVRAFQIKVPSEIQKISEGLMYRDFIIVGLLLRDLKIREENGQFPKDNWIYIQEPEVQIGRVQIFNNWSPYLIADPQTIWIGAEYFCQEQDQIWKLPNQEMIKLAVKELSQIEFISEKDVLDATVIRMPKTYPAYFGTYEHFNQLRNYLNQFENLFLIGRNGMHRYNNMDHSMLTAKTAVDNIICGRKDKSNIWAVNTEKEYHEKK